MSYCRDSVLRKYRPDTAAEHYQPELAGVVEVAAGCVEQHDAEPSSCEVDQQR